MYKEIAGSSFLEHYKQIAILRRQYHIILTASWEKIYIQLVLYRDPSFIRINKTVN